MKEVSPVLAYAPERNENHPLLLPPQGVLLVFRRYYLVLFAEKVPKTLVTCPLAKNLPHSLKIPDYTLSEGLRLRFAFQFS